MTEQSPQGPNVTDPDARALLAAASSITSALDMILCAVRDGEVPNTEEITLALCDALNNVLGRYPNPEAYDLAREAGHFLGLD